MAGESFSPTNTSLGQLLYLEGQSELVKHLTILDSIQRVAAALVEVSVGGGRLQKQLLLHVWVEGTSGQKLIEDVVVPLLTGLEAEARELQEIVLDDAAADLCATVEAHLDELAKPGAVVVSHSFGISCKIRQA